MQHRNMEKNLLHYMSNKNWRSKPIGDGTALEKRRA